MRVLAVIVAIGFTASLDAQKKDPYKRVDNDVRLAALRHAQVWMPVDVATADIRTGPTDVTSYPPGAEVACDYVEEEVTGTPKFNCRVGPDDKIRVKYGEKNGEVYAEVAATRLLWALGFGADRVYPVTVVCDGCPDDPIKRHKKVDGTRTFTHAVIERKMPGDEIEIFKDSGWSWIELTFIDRSAGGAAIEHRDALRLLAALIQHTDNKPQQQRLMCLDRTRSLPAAPDGSCAHPLMMINDTGKTFGTATMFNNDAESAVNFKEWSSTPVWKGETGCVAQLSRSMTGSLEHPAIGEAGRKFLSGLLSQLSDQQLRDLFDVAQFLKRDPNTSVDDWVGAFKKKRDAISSRSCQS